MAYQTESALFTVAKLKLDEKIQAEFVYSDRVAQAAGKISFTDLNYSTNRE